MASNASQLAMGALAAAVVGVGVIWLLPSPESTLATLEPPELAALVTTPAAEDVAEIAEEATTAIVAAEEKPVVAVPTVGMRAEGDGILVVTGRANGASELDIMLDGTALERLLVDGSGSYATVLSIPASDQGRILSVISDPDGAAVASVENPLILPVSIETEAPADVVIAGAVTDVDEEQLAELLAEPPAVEIIAEVVETPVVKGEQVVAVAEGVETTVEELAVVEPEVPDVGGESAAETTLETEQIVEQVIIASEEVSEGEGIGADEMAGTSTAGVATSGAVTESAELTTEPDVSAVEAEIADASPATDTVLVADQDGVRVVSADGAGLQVLSNVALDSISYDPAGEVLLTGRATGGGFVQVYVDNQPITTSRIAKGGGWRTDLPEVDTGVYTLRIDEVDEDGIVVSRIETPFKREKPETVAAVLAEETSQDDFKVAVKTVQPGATLWAIAREQFGEGIMYVAVYEANRDQIRNPDLIYPGQVFRIPEASE